MRRRTIEERAISEWGITNVPQFAIYMLKNGEMINGSYEGFQRDRDHREINEFMPCVKNVIGSYIKYTYDFLHQYYIQFDSNPFFEPMGYIEYYTHKHRMSTGLTELPHIWDNVNPYSVEDDNITQLIKNLKQAEEYLKSLSFVCRDQYVAHRDNFEQKIYNH